MDQAQLRKEALDFLNSHRKAVLATNGADEHPTTSLMLYAIDNDFNVYFGTRMSFAKYEIFQRHPYTSVSVIQESIDPLKTVEIRGKIEFIPKEKTVETLKFFESKNPSKYYVKDAEDFVMFKVTPSFIRYLDATSGNLVMRNIEC